MKRPSYTPTLAEAESMDDYLDEVEERWDQREPMFEGAKVPLAWHLGTCLALRIHHEDNGPQAYACWVRFCERHAMAVTPEGFWIQEMTNIARVLSCVIDNKAEGLTDLLTEVEKTRRESLEREHAEGVTWRSTSPAMLEALDEDAALCSHDRPLLDYCEECAASGTERRD
jgi:hypothetical protein